MEKAKLLVGRKEFTGYEIETFLEENIKLLLKDSYQENHFYSIDWNYNEDYRDEITVIESRWETEEELEIRKNKEKEREDKRKEQKEKEERNQYEKLKAKFEKQ